MRLTVMERLLTQGLLPEKGSFSNLKLIREAREALSFTEAENKELKFVEKEGQITWTEAQGIPSDVNIEIGEVATEMIKKELRKLNDKDELAVNQVSLYSKFIEA